MENKILMNSPSIHDIREITGQIPYRMALAGGWIDQPFISRLNPSPPGSMVVVNLEPSFYFMERCGMGTSTRKVAIRLWNNEIPVKDPADLVRELYVEENRNKLDPSGSQDMAGLIYPGINRLDYDANHEEGIFPVHVESNNDQQISHWLEENLYLLPVNQRPSGYSPLGIRNLDPQWIERLGKTGKECYDAILNKNLVNLGRSMNECMRCWESILPHTVHHPALTVDLLGLLNYYQERYAGAMYSGCGGGYLFVVSEESVPGAFRGKIRTSPRITPLRMIEE